MNDSDSGKENLGEVDVFCPTCNQVVIARIKSVVDSKYVVTGRGGLYGEDEDCEFQTYRIGFCIRCDHAFLFRDTIQIISGEYSTIVEEEILFPNQTKSIPEHLPDSVRKAYERALSCFQTANYEPCAIMARKCIEGLCHELGSNDGSLKQRLEKLAAENKIDNRLIMWADHLRIVGNDAAHEFDIEFSKDDAKDSLDFVEAILVNVFTMNKKFEDFKSRRKKKNIN